MKRLLFILPLIVLCGCGIEENTPMQAVVDKYKTDQVKPVPYRVGEFIVRDTNSAVWYVETAKGGMNTNGNYEWSCIRNTLLFDGIKKVDKIKLED